MTETVGQIGRSTISRETWDSVAPGLEPASLHLEELPAACQTMRSAVLATMRSQAPR